VQVLAENKTDAIVRIAMQVGSKQTAWRRSDWFIWRFTLHCHCRCCSSGALCG